MKNSSTNILIYAWLLVMLLSYNGYAQKSPVYFAEVGTTVSTTGQTPFWLRTNQYGIVPFEASPFSARIGLKSNSDTTTGRKKFSLNYGIEIVGNTGKESKFLLPEAYLKLKFGVFELYGGRQREMFGLVDSTLSSGSFTWSGNALPIPKLQLSIPEYVPIGFTKKLFAFKGMYAHGWLDPTRSDVSGGLLHQKALFIRVGKPTWAMKFHFGFIHDVQWGGQQLRGDKINFPVNLSSYWNVITGRSISDTTNIKTLGVNEALNRLGNHLGSLDVGIEIQTPKLSILLYRQSVFEDGSLAYLINIVDGLNGISITNKVKKQKDSFFHWEKIVFEVFNSKSQGGGSFEESPYARGLDNYFINNIFTDGWTYFGKPIGSAFISPYSDSKRILPKFSVLGFSKEENVYYFSNNTRVLAYYLGFDVNFKNIFIKGKVSYSYNLGTYEVPFPTNTNQFSMLIKAQKPVNWWKGASVTAAFSLDNGSLYDNNIGGYIGVRTTVH